MIWLFERDAESLRVETLYDNKTSEVVVTVHWPDSRTQSFRFPDLAACRTWLLAWERSREGERWARNGPPIVLPYGWPDNRPS